MALLCIVAGLLLCACGKPRKAEDEWIQSAARRAQAAASPAPSPVPDELAEAAVEIRGRLSDFHLRMFPALIESPFFFDQSLQDQADYYAHRLLIPERDAAREKAEKWLGDRVVIDHFKIRRGITRIPVRYAYFADEIQRHRDEFASILSEMEISNFGPAELNDFCEGVRLQFGRAETTARTDLPWSMTVLAKKLQPGAAFRNADGTTGTLTQIARMMAEGPPPAEAAEPFACYAYHTLYALVVATASGHKKFAPAARELFEQAFQGANALNSPDRPGFGGAEELIARIKINGHLIEAFFRASEEDFPLAEFRSQITPIMFRLREDSRILTRDGMKYEGSPKVFLAAPHAIHAMDLAIPRLGASTAGMPTYRMQDRRLQPNEAIQRAQARQAAKARASATPAPAE